jgi:hypothetical protein
MHQLRHPVFPESIVARVVRPPAARQAATPSRLRQHEDELALEVAFFAEHLRLGGLGERE